VGGIGKENLAGTEMTNEPANQSDHDFAIFARKDIREAAGEALVGSGKITGRRKSDPWYRRKKEYRRDRGREPLNFEQQRSSGVHSSHKGC